MFFMEYGYILLTFLIVLALGATLLSIGALVRPSVRNKFKLSPYESGMPILDDAHVSFNARYYLIAVMFVIFDIETIFLIPWAVHFDVLGLFGLIEIFIFITILIVGYFYAYRKGTFVIKG